MKNFPCAKINLGLNVVERRPDGYHNLETVFYPVRIEDSLEVVCRKQGLADGTSKKPSVSGEASHEERCNLTVTGVSELCEPHKNLVYKAYSLLANDFKQLPMVDVVLHKRIPSQAGMGGGSSDAAYMIRLLNEQFELGLTTEKMREYAARLGADCAFFITSDASHPQPLYATGIGDVLSPLPTEWNALEDKWIALVKPDVAVSTKEAYAGIKQPRRPRKNCRDILLQPIETWREELTNDFEESIFPKLPVLAEVKQAFYEHGALYAAMSGSGSTVFGIFAEEPTFVKQQFAQYYNHYYCNCEN